MRMRSVLLACAAALSAGCLTPASGRGMAVPAAELEAKASPAVAGAVLVGSVAGGKKSFSSIDDAELKVALVESLRGAGMLAEGPGAPLALDARVVEVGNGEGGGVFDSSVRVAIRYTVRETRAGGVVIDEVIAATYVATTSDALVGATRHVRAIEGAARKNLAVLVKRLNSIQRKAPAAAAAPR